MPDPEAQREAENAVKTDSKKEEPGLSEEILTERGKLFRTLDLAAVDPAEQRRLEEVLIGRPLTPQERKELKKIRTEERMNHSMVVLRTQTAEVYAVGVPIRGSDIPDVTWVLGFALCMPEEMALPRAQRRLAGFRKARRRALLALARSLSGAEVDLIAVRVPKEERVYPHLRKTALNAVWAACEIPFPWEALGFAAYHGDSCNSRMEVFFNESPFVSQFLNRYGEELNANSDDESNKVDAE